MKLLDWKNIKETRRTVALVSSIVGAGLTFIVVAQCSLLLCGASLFALILAAWCAVLVFNYIPVHMLARIRPETMHPQARVFDLRTIDTLATVKETLSREYFGGKSWASRAEDKEKKELVFACRFQEPDINDKGQTMIDIELQLLVSVKVIDEKAAVQLDYRLNDSRPSVLANDIAEETTANIWLKLEQQEYQR